MYDFRNKVALVTGGSRGIGRAISLALGKGGATVVVNYAGNEAAALETCGLVEAAGGRAEARRFDVGDPTACQAAIDEIVSAHGGLHVLVNNAGIAIDALLMRLKDADLERQLDVNLKAAFFLCRAAARPMMKQRGGAIVNLTSVVGEMGNAGQTAYAAAKAGLVGFTKSLARELASRGVRANLVSPGFIDTDMTRDLPAEVRARMLEAIPLGRLGTADEVADAVAWLASDRSAYVTGELIRVNGGMYM
ncbi:MAG TPA: 3-oxoacyl-[acyl-carrier-protein] reductase [Vulgatibacter sp.]|nr:3-oxoacyl-[acyl-carrier-protein] reductase [Vulgatibacter sp.]